MVFDAFDELNWLAVLVGTAAWFVFSAIWYSVPPLSGAWQRAARVTPSEGPPLPAILAATFVLYFVTAVVIALLARAVGAATFGDGLALGVAVGVGFGLATAAVTQLYEAKGGAYAVLNGGNAVVGFSLVAVIVTLWD